jgi:hypothetical protein
VEETLRRRFLRRKFSEEVDEALSGRWREGFDLWKSLKFVMLLLN